MLIQFSVQNFCSFHEETNIDMRAAEVAPAGLKLPAIAGNNTLELLPLAAIYCSDGNSGADIMEATRFLPSFLFATLLSGINKKHNTCHADKLSAVYSTFQGKEYVLQQETTALQPAYNIRRSSRKFSPKLNISFRTDGSDYRYWIQLCGQDIKEEYLFLQDSLTGQPINIFERDVDGIYLDDGLSEVEISRLRSTMPLLTYIYLNSNHHAIDKAVQWLAGVMLPVGDDLQEEALLTLVEAALESGRLMVVDGLDIRLSPDRLQYVLRQYHDPAVNQRGAQLVCSLQDQCVMNSAYLRRDEIWFAVSKRDDSSTIYSLAEFQNGEEAVIDGVIDYAPLYRQGRYGCEPKKAAH